MRPAARIGSCTSATGDDVCITGSYDLRVAPRLLVPGFVNTPLSPNSNDLRADLERLEREIEQLRVRIAEEAAVATERHRSRRLARTSRAESKLLLRRALRLVSIEQGPIAELPSAHAPPRTEATPPFEPRSTIEPLPAVDSLETARARRAIAASDDDGPQAA